MDFSHIIVGLRVNFITLSFSVVNVLLKLASHEEYFWSALTALKRVAAIVVCNVCSLHCCSYSTETNSFY